MKTVRQRLLPAFMLVVVCGVVAATVSRVYAKDKQDGWEDAITEVKVMSMHLEMYDQLVGLIDGMNEIHASPSASAEMAIMGLDDHLAPAERVDFLEEMLDEKWFGHRVSAEVQSRLGDVAMLPFEKIGFDDPDDTGPMDLIGRHGSLTGGEMYVPCVVATA